MRSRALISVLLIAIFLLPSHVFPDEKSGSEVYIATYFFTNVRCPSCLSIEKLTSETIQAEFAQELGSGVLKWRTVNVEGEGNFHYVKDYNLYTKSVIISQVVDGKEVRWKNLVKVWELLRNEGKFKKYVKDEVTSFMAGS
jgi:hypothetical protein